MKKHILLILLIIFPCENLFAKETSDFPQPTSLKEPKPSKIPDDKMIFNFIYENDVFNHRDYDYTNGVRLSWLSSEKGIPRKDQKTIDEQLPFVMPGKKRLSFAVGQSMFTPRNLSDPNLIPNDRPYAGWLYGSAGIVADNGKKLDNLMLTIGVVGPYSFAEQTQKFIHRDITDSPNPEGWSNQLHTEPGAILTYERKWRHILEFAPYKFGFDLTPDAGFDLGNIYTDASAGLTARVGYDLPQDYGPPRIRPSLPGSDFFIPRKTLGGYLFVGAHARAVARNIFLDGNSFEDSHKVSKKPVVGELQYGVAVTYQDWRLSYTQVYLTREFYEQDKPEKFGAVSVSYRF